MRRSDYTWEGGGMMRMPCMECNQMFSARRDDACYCSVNCRKKASRRKAHVKEAAAIAIEQIEFLKKTRQLRPDLEDDVLAAFNDIRWYIPQTKVQQSTLQLNE
jgi:hypothetical protein